MVDDYAVLEEIINNHFRQPMDINLGATGTILEEDGILFVQKCLHGEYYYQSSEIYGDTDKSTTIMAHSTDIWSLCDSASSLKDNPISDIPYDFDQWLLEKTEGWRTKDFLMNVAIITFLKWTWKKHRSLYNQVFALQLLKIGKE